MKIIWTHAVVVAAMLFWGMSFIWSKIVFETYSPVTTILFRLIVSVAILFPFIYLSKQKQKIRKSDFKFFFFSAVFNPFLYFIGENFGLQQVSASLTSVIISTIPVITPFVVFLFYKERVTKLNIAGLFISFAGIIVIVMADRIDLRAKPEGLMFLTLAVLSAIVYSLYVKRLTFHYHAITIIAWQNLIGIFLFLPLFLITDGTTPFTVIPDRKTVFSLFMLGLFASSLAFIFYTYGIQKLGIIKTNLYTNLIPVFAFIFAFIILNEVVTLQKIAGLLIVLTGIVLSEINKGKEVMLGKR